MRPHPGIFPNLDIRAASRWSWNAVTVGIVVLAASCGAASACLVATTWNVFANEEHSLEDAIRVMQDQDATPAERDGARFILNRETHRIISVLREDAHPQSDKLLGNIKEAAAR